MEHCAVYPILEAEMTKRKIKKQEMAQALGIDKKSLYNKLNGRCAFTWDEVTILRSTFFPDMRLEALMEKNG